MRFQPANKSRTTQQADDQGGDSRPAGPKCDIAEQVKRLNWSANGTSSSDSMAGPFAGVGVSEVIAAHSASRTRHAADPFDPLIKSGHHWLWRD